MFAPTPRSMELAILRLLSRERHLNIFNVIGRTGQGGALATALGMTFDKATRNLALRCFRTLEDKGLVQPTLTDLMDPKDWFEITDAGRDALVRGAVDELDVVLNSIHPRLPEIRAGAWDAVHFGGADALRQAAHSGRELIDITLKEGAPDDQVRAQPGFQRDKTSTGGITRKHRLKYLMITHKSTASESKLSEAERAIDLLMQLSKRMSADAHSRSTPEKQEVIDALYSSEAALRAVLT